MSNSTYWSFLCPRYWLVWLGVGVLWLATHLPWRFSLMLSGLPGRLLYYLVGERRRVACLNLAIAFPELSAAERKKRVKQHFISATQGLFEAALSWWGSEQRIRRLIRIEGQEQLDMLKDSKQGIILLSAHFTSLELGGRMLVSLLEGKPLHVVYRPHQNALLEYLVARNRERRYGKAIGRNNIRDMVRSLRDGHPVWYAPDQAYKGKSSVKAEFFGQTAATNSATSRLSKMAGAKVLPFFTVRDPRGNGYILRFLAPLDDFPSADELADVRRVNTLFEAQIREFPEQYLWTHKRFKQRGRDFYQQHELLQQGGCR